MRSVPRSPFERERCGPTPRPAFSVACTPLADVARATRVENREEREPKQPGTRIAPALTIGSFLVIGAGFLGLAVTWEPYAEFAAALSLASVAALATLRLGTLRFATHCANRADGVPAPASAEAKQPFLSVHVPCCDEPPEVVLATLDALARALDERSEVIVIDNNTPKRETWTPVAEHCLRLGPRFRFLHRERLDGGKAAALEVCRSIADPRATHAFVIDADYIVRSHALHRAIECLEGGRFAFVQFPQAYRNVPAQGGLEAEYQHYFDLYLPMADRLGAPLLTGTLCLVELAALEAVGGWSASTITEDAELGLRLNQAGYRGCYCPDVVGRGLMPGKLDTLRRQRRRWAFGNAQTLFGAGPRVLWRLGARRAAAIVTQLTAWFDLILLPAAILVLGAVLDASGRGPSRLTAELAGAAIVLSIGVRAALLGHTLQASGLRALVCHLALTWERATAWIECAAGVRLPFLRTDKTYRRGFQLPHLSLAAALALLGVASFYAARGLPLATMGVLVVALSFALRAALAYELSTVADLAFAPASGRAIVPEAPTALSQKPTL